MNASGLVERLRSELELLLAGEKAASDFVSRFYMLIDEAPTMQRPLRALIEDFHFQVANFEPREEVRLQELGLIDEIQLREKARVFLSRLQELETGEFDDLG